MKHFRKDSSSSLKPPERQSRSSSILIPQTPKLDNVYNRIDNLEQYADSLSASIRTLDQKFKQEIIDIKRDKAEDSQLFELSKDFRILKKLVEDLSASHEVHKAEIEAKVADLDTNRISTLEEKVRFHDEITRLNTSRIENLEKDVDKLRKLLSTLNNVNIDLSQFDRMEASISKLDSRIEGVRKNLVAAVKEIREILMTKADDDVITELENKVLIKLNELAENICKKFADKTETKIGFKNVNKLVKDLYNFMLMIPRETAKKEEDNAMLSKKPLGGFSCASCDKNIVNLQRHQSVEALNWNQLPFRDKSDKFSKVGVEFSKILNSARNELSPPAQYRTKLKKLGEISESMSQCQNSKIEEKLDLTNMFQK
jgi:hypothetical protein